MAFLPRNYRFLLLMILPCVIAGFFFYSKASYAPAPLVTQRQTYDFVERFDESEQLSDSTVLIYRGRVHEDNLLSGWGLGGKFGKTDPRIWVLGNSASLRFFSSGSEAKRLIMDCVPVSSQETTPQIMKVSVRGKVIGEMDLKEGNARCALDIPKDSVVAGFNQLKLEFSRTASPGNGEAGKKEDRKLAANFGTLMVLPVSSAPKIIDPTPIRLVNTDSGKSIAQECRTRCRFFTLIPSQAEIKIRYGYEGKNSANLRLIVKQDGKPETVALNLSEEPGQNKDWKSARASLAEYAGQVVRLTFSVDPKSEKSPLLGGTFLWSGQIFGEIQRPPVLKKPPFKPPKLIVHLSLDTLRADALSCYGYGRATSPTIDQFAKDSVLFEKVYSSAPSTLPSHASLFTSLYPATTNAQFLTRTSLREDVETIAETFQKAGYKTVAFTGGGQLDSAFKIGRGFDEYQQVEEDFAVTVAKAIEWYEANKPDKLYMFLHTYQIHVPYQPPAEYASRFIDPNYAGPLGLSVDRPEVQALEDKRLLTPADTQRAKDIYDAEIRFCDDVLKSLFEWLKSKGLYNGAMITIASDHGEEFAEHGATAMHSHSQYEELLRVPLIMKLPRQRQAGMRISSMARLCDILPTFAEVAGLSPVPQAVGSSLIPLAFGLEGDPDKRNYAHGENMRRESMNFRNWKEIINQEPRASDRLRFIPRLEFYNLADDPEEKTDVSGQFPIMKDYLAVEMKSIRKRIREDLQNKNLAIPGTVVFSPGLTKELQGLGYIGRGAAKETEKEIAHEVSDPTDGVDSSVGGVPKGATSTEEH